MNRASFTFLRKDDGIWLLVNSSTNKKALINWTALCYKHDPITGDALMQWTEDCLAGSSKGECERCKMMDRQTDVLSDCISRLHQEEQKCAEWEKAYADLGHKLHMHYGWNSGSMDLWRTLDPRRKPEPKPNWFVADDFASQ